MNSQRRDFDKEAASWDEHPARVKLAEDVASAIAQQVTLRREMDVLDFGCGTGLVTLKLASLVKSITAVDSSQGMLDVLKKKAHKQGRTNVLIRHLSPGHSLPGLYDVIVSSMTFHHVEHIDALLAQLFQALKTPGYLCVADLDSDQGEFHDDNTGVFHFGFERATLHQALVQTGFLQVKDVTATEIMKPTRNGGLRKFSVFMMIGEKIAK
jgi:2-polyprenyl-3-methyl-5-hydroxy-6-metoxy-1,4-benzoquinol methylase